MSTESYEYTPLAGRRQIRLLKLHPAASPDDPELSVDLVTVSLGAAPFFEALSYAWGEHLPRYEIRCSGRRVEIGQSLYSALYHLRRLQAPWWTPWIWADALCINQNDTAEREAQVLMMGDIYSAAYITVIWLGEQDDCVTRAFDWLGRFSNIWQSFKESHDIGNIIGSAQAGVLEARLSATNNLEARAILRTAFGDESSQTNAIKDIWLLLRRPWFMRKWVIQEVAMSQHHRMVFAAGERWTHWVHLHCWFVFLRLSADSTKRVILSCPWGTERDPHDETNPRSIFAQGDILAQVVPSSGLPLSHLLVGTAGFKCAVPSDRIIALISIAGDSSIFENLIDYGVSTDELYRRLTSAYLTNSLGLRILWSTYAMIPVDRRRINSWIPSTEEMEFRGGASTMANLTAIPHRMANACGSTNIEASTNGNILQIRGRIIDFVEQLGTDMTVFPELFRPWRVSFTEEYQRLLGLRQNWLDECHIIAESANQDEYSFLDAILIQNVLPGISTEIKEAAKKNFFQYRQNMRAFVAAEDQQTWSKVLESMDSDMMRSTNYIEELHGQLRLRRFGRTRYGKIGWMPTVAEEGDHICVFDGMELPYAVRQSKGSGGNYVLVGDCLIPTLMNGEAMEMPDVESVIITLE